MQSFTSWTLSAFLQIRPLSTAAVHLARTAGSFRSISNLLRHLVRGDDPSLLRGHERGSLSVRNIKTDRVQVSIYRQISVRAPHENAHGPRLALPQVRQLDVVTRRSKTDRSRYCCDANEPYQT